MKDDKMYKDKALFVKKFVLPLAVQLNLGVVDMEYKAESPNPEHPEWVFETVTVYYGSERFEKHAVVNGDSNFAILKDLIKQEAIG